MTTDTAAQTPLTDALGRQANPPEFDAIRFTNPAAYEHALKTFAEWAKHARSLEAQLAEVRDELTGVAIEANRSYQAGYEKASERAGQDAAQMREQIASILKALECETVEDALNEINTRY